MCVLYRFRCTQEAKKPQLSRAAHRSQFGTYSVFQSEIERRANAHTERGSVQT
jgi:hypothetical protein